MTTTPAPPEDQARLLEDALIAVRQQTVLMRKCLDSPSKLMDALKCWYATPWQLLRAVHPTLAGSRPPVTLFILADLSIRDL